MKKIKQLVLLLLFSTSYCVFAQHNSGIVTYGQKILIPNKKKSLEHSKFSNYYNEERKKMNENSKRISYSLKFNEFEASFISNKSMSIGESNDDVEYAILHVGGNGKYYFSSKTNKSLWAHDVFGSDVIVVDTINSNDWKITKETKLIGKYKVVKAIKEKQLGNDKVVDVVAWFAPEIPNSYGPIGHYGLPGLILELQERDFILFAKEVKFRKKVIQINKPFKGKQLSREEYYIFADKAARDFIIN